MATISNERRTVASRTVLLDLALRPVSLGSKPVPVPPGPRPADTLPLVVLEDLLTLPGAIYAGLVHLEDGQVLAEAGRTGPEACASVRYLAAAVRTALAAYGADPGDMLDDFVVTSRRSYDMVRQVPGLATAGTQVLYLRVDRDRGNLAQARYRLAACSLLQARPPSLHRRAPHAVPLAPAPALGAVEPTSSAVPTGWANDLTTLRRLRTALRCSA